MNLYTQKKRLLNGRYEGKAIYVSDLIGDPIRILRYEIVESPRNKGKELLVAQVEHKGELRLLFTEAFVLIKTLRDVAGVPPFETKIVKKRDGCYEFSKLNNVELNKLLNHD